MAYQVFARKYRPQDFTQVIGQDPVITTLKNAITHERLHHAYLFCGARGVGKTSMARIFAKSLNCEKGPTITPCQVCGSCVEITKSNSMDVLEIDGASNTGVDDVRELREQAKYLPVAGKYKIYIIDEVHMLSTNAFNALLKILEEPPPHLIFCFATTEPHKIPVTILSRCQRFDYKRVSYANLVKHLQFILQSEKITLPEESLYLIARASEGSVRDSLSLMDQVVSFCGDNAGTDQIRDMLGLADRVILINLLNGLLTKDINTVLDLVNKIYDKGFDLKILGENLLELFRHLAVIKEGGEKYVDLPVDEIETLKKLAANYDTFFFLTQFQVLGKGVEEIARSDFPRLLFETTLIKMMHARELMPIAELAQKMAAGGGSSESPRAAGSASVASPSPRASLTVPSLSSSPARSVAPLASAPVTSDRKFVWNEFVSEVLKKMPSAGAMLEHGRPLNIEASKVELGFENSMYLKMLEGKKVQIEALLEATYKRKIEIFTKQMPNMEGAPASALEVRETTQKEKDDALRKKALASPALKLTQDILGGRVTEVKVSKEIDE